MTRLIIFFLLITANLGVSAQQEGDLLAILYQRVYAYKNPGDLSSRYNKIPFSFRDKNKLIFIAKSEQYPKYFQVKTVKGDTVFVKEKLVSVDQKLTHEQIELDIENGIRKENYGDIFYQNKTDVPTWIPILIIIVFVAVLYFLRRYFTSIDRWFCRKNNSVVKQLSNPWFINYSLYSGLVIGSMQLISKNEYRWFLQEGMQIWGSYPSKWDWIMWAAVVAVIAISIVSIVQAFVRFQVKIALSYTLFTLIMIGLYYLVGLLIGAIALVIVIFFAVGSGGKTGPASGTSLYNSSGMYVGKAK